MAAGEMVLEKMLGLVAVGTFTGETKRMIGRDDFSLPRYLLDFFASAFLAFCLAYVYLLYRGREDVAPFLGGILGYLGSDFLEKQSRAFMAKGWKGGEADG